MALAKVVEKLLSQQSRGSVLLHTCIISLMEVSVRLKEVQQEEDEDDESENEDCGDEETEDDDDDDEVGSFIFVKSIQNKFCCNGTFSHSY